MVGNPACADTCAMPEPMSPQPITPTCLMAMPERPPLERPADCGVRREPLLVPDEGLDAISPETLAALQEDQLDEKVARHDVAAEPLDQAKRRRHGSTCCQQIVHREHVLASPNGVLVNGQDIPSVLELVLLLDHRAWQLALLSDGHETGAQLLGQRAAEDESAGLDTDHDIHLGRAISGGEMVDHRTPRLAILEERGDVLEEDAFGWEILDIADLCGERGYVHDRRGSYLPASRDATRNAGAERILSRAGGRRGDGDR